MMYRTIRLRTADDKGVVEEREYVIHTPTYAALGMLDKAGYPMAQLSTYFSADLGFTAAFLAAALTDIEPRVSGRKRRIWTPGEIADELLPGPDAASINSAVGDIITELRDTWFPWVPEALAMVVEKDDPSYGLMEAKADIDKRDGGALPPALSQKTGSPKPSKSPAPSKSS